MNPGDGTSWPAWLRLAGFLAASVAVHAALGLYGWPGAGTVPSAAGTLPVTLVTSLPPAPPRPAVTPPQGAQRLSAPSARQTVPPIAPVTARSVPEPAPAVATTVDPLPGQNLPTAGGGGSAGEVAVRPLPTLSATGPAAAKPPSLTMAIPRYASNPKPEYPRLARQNRWEGVVQLRASVATTGKVEQVVVEQGSGHVVLDQAAVSGVRRWRFVPARYGDQLIACEVRIPIAFRLEE